ncbi:hypothetical protein NRS6134_21460 (plasmid) [Bacillus subtilis]|nr:hypothetical protein DS740_22465 [Bacillus sp. DM2]PAM75828.1 hypothetical protein CFD21_20850 [Bacillus subtilis]QRZ95013.1 hypothetical protein JQX68_21635 [Bacillus sp. LJBS06]QAW48248.1 hypothetical protein ETK71_21905 [Bacillus subtilis]QGI15758.1 hypothetical protein GII80_22095 [Bacillus subtilis]
MIMGSVDIAFTNSSQVAQNAQTIATTTQENLNEVKNNIVYKIDILSTNGTSFKNGLIDTTLVAVAFKGKDNITSSLPSSAFIWTKTNADGTPDDEWNQAHVGVGNTITITSEDVYSRATFQCDLDIEDEM